MNRWKISDQESMSGMPPLGEQVGLMLGKHIKRADADLMLQDKQMMQDPEMPKEMERVRAAYAGYDGQLEEVAETMECIRKVSGAPARSKTELQEWIDISHVLSKPSDRT